MQIQDSFTFRKSMNEFGLESARVNSVSGVCRELSACDGFPEGGHFYIHSLLEKGAASERSQAEDLFFGT